MESSYLSWVVSRRKSRVNKIIIFQRTITPGSDPYSCQNTPWRDEWNGCPSGNQQIYPGYIWSITPSMQDQWNQYLMLELGIFPPSNMWYLKKIYPLWIIWGRAHSLETVKTWQRNTQSLILKKIHSLKIVESSLILKHAST